MDSGATNSGEKPGGGKTASHTETLPAPSQGWLMTACCPSVLPVRAGARKGLSHARACLRANTHAAQDRVWSQVNRVGINLP